MFVRWNQTHDSWRDIRALQRHFDDVFGGLFEPQSQLQTSSARRGPGFNVTEGKDAYVLEAALPGVKEKDIEVDATANSVTIKGSRQTEAPQGYTVHRRERNGLNFARTFTFKSRLDLEQVRATLNHGLLTLKLRKHETEQPRKIAIHGA